VARRGVEGPRRWHIAVLVAAPLAIYWTGLSSPFVLDDRVAIVENQSIRDLWSLRVLAPGRELPTSGRPLVNVAHAVNYAVGGIDPYGYHLLNLALHVSCALLVYALVRRTLEMSRVPGAVRSRSADVAALSALVWAVHPLNTEVVEYVTQRSESMMAFCYLLALYGAVRALDPAHRRRWQAIAIGSCAAGMLCKESMVTAPVAAWLFDRTFVFGTWRDALRARWRLYGALAATWILLAAAIWSGPRAYSAGFSTDVSASTYALNQLVIVPHYLALAIWPRDLVVAYGPPEPVTLAAAMPSALIVGALLVATCVALWARPLLGFVGAWFFLLLAPTSSFVPIATEVAAERRVYLALVPLVILAIAGVAAVAARVAPGRARAAWGVVWAIAVILAAVAVARVREYTSPLDLAETVLKRRPTAFAHALVGTQLAIEGRHDEAIAELRQAVPGYPRAHYDLGGELFNKGSIDEALPELQTFVRRLPLLAEVVPARLMIGRALMLRRDPAGAESELRAVLRMAPPRSERHVIALGYLADTLIVEERFDEAIACYREFIAARPLDAAAQVNLGVALARLGRLPEAQAAFKRALQIDPANVLASKNLAAAQQEMREER
jgi:tetratricopeptide (TPR) repeat protein